MCKDCWFSKYNKVLPHYSVSMATARGYMALLLWGKRVWLLLLLWGKRVWLPLLLLWGKRVWLLLWGKRVWLLLLKCRLLLTVFAF